MKPTQNLQEDPRAPSSAKFAFISLFYMLCLLVSEPADMGRISASVVFVSEMLHRHLLVRALSAYSTSSSSRCHSERSRFTIRVHYCTCECDHASKCLPTSSSSRCDLKPGSQFLDDLRQSSLGHMGKKPECPQFQRA